MQRFTTTDELRLEVEGDPPPGDLLNLLPNPVGAWGGYGWLSPIANTTVDGASGPFSGHPTALEVRTTVTQPVHITSEPVPVTAGHYVGVWVTEVTLSAGIGGWMLKIEYLNDAGDVVATHTATAPRTARLTNRLVPAGATSARLRLDLYANSDGTGNPAAGSLFRFADATFSTSPTVTTALTLLFFSPQTWVDILGPTATLVVERRELDLGILTADILDETLDPAAATTIETGRKIRLITTAGAAIFTGEIHKATVAYDLLHPDPTKRTRITLSAVDNTAPLTNAPRPDGVSAIGELSYVLEGAGVPWNLNGETGHAPTDPPIVTRNPNAKALDQIAVVRDSALGYAWVDRRGVLTAYDVDQLPGLDPAASVLDEAAYVDVDVDYDTERCINVVLLKVLRLDPVTGDTEEVDYGPYVDLASRKKNGAREATFTVQGIDEDPAVLAAYAEAIFAANATPKRRLNGATLNLTTTVDLGAWATLDLYEARRVLNDRAGLDETARVVGLRHTITAGRQSSWRLELDFAAEGNVAQPAAVPSPPPTGAATLAQLLRPVGEVTMMMGLPSQLWPGWLILNGAALTVGEYPELEAWLAAAGLSTSVLPDFTDRLPVAAGIKAVGAATGAWTKTIATANLPAIPVRWRDNAGITGTAKAMTDVGTTTGATGGSTGSFGGAAPLDITPRVIGVYFIIRARSGA